MNNSVENEFVFLIAGWSYIFIEKQVPPQEQMENGSDWGKEKPHEEC